MSPSSKATSVLTIRIPRSLDRRLSAEARRLRRTRSEAARAILDAALGAEGPDPATEARRQCLLASRQDADQDTLDFIATVADDRGWR
ncbi:MAG TPA: ribbon-helix-helix protein, CopG family [Vicinamibacterales bacterium]|nr:ribbon-helix-helix protein, CopG family [Vicinamibacterales bacterium]